MNSSESRNLLNWGEWSSAASAWNTIQDHLDIPKKSREIWIKPLIPIHLAGNRLTIKCPNPFFKEWILDEYFNRLTESSEKLGITIHLIV